MFRVTAASLAVLIGALVAAPATAAADEGLLADQRALFISAWDAVEQRRWKPTERERAFLSDYVLWPDLEGRNLEKNLRTSNRKRIEAFLAGYPSSSAARSLRYRWAKKLAARGDWNGYLAIYDAHYADLGETVLDCLAVKGAVRSGRKIDAGQVLDLWLVGRSQPDECDTGFKWLEAAGHLDKAARLERFELALDAREFNLAAWLARKIGAGEQRRAAAWKAMRDNPRRHLSRYARLSDTPDNRARILYGFERLARKDTAYADRLWRTVRPHFSFSASEAAGAGEAIALVAAWRHDPLARELIARVPVAERSSELREWGVRAALREEDWAGVLAAIAEMPAVQSREPRWRYWRARALAERGVQDDPQELLRGIAAERSYYGFLAADAVGLDYAFMNDPLAVDESRRDKLKAQPELIRGPRAVPDRQNRAGPVGMGRLRENAGARRCNPGRAARARLGLAFPRDRNRRPLGSLRRPRRALPAAVERLVFERIGGCKNRSRMGPRYRTQRKSVHA